MVERRGLAVTIVIGLLLHSGATLEENSGSMSDDDDDALVTKHSMIEIRKHVKNHNMVLQEISGLMNKHLLTYKVDSLPEYEADVLYRRQDCADAYKVEAIRASGIYTVYPDRKTGIQVYCDMDTAGGGWTIFQRRRDGSVSFNQSWDGYKHGFGSLVGEFWLGNDNLALLTSLKVYSLRVDMQDFDLNEAYAEYNDFLVLPEERGYRLVLAAFNSYTGTAGDSMWPHAGHAFSTYDRDNDVSYVQHCAHVTGAGFWFYNCQMVGLNGQYSDIPQIQHGQGIVWRSWHGSAVSLKRVEMKYRPVDY